jgi:tetratricopeptide (TPR) repeat protein
MAVDWTSFLGAASWALHPLRVEPVAWVTGRNDLLSGCLAILGVLSWLRHASGSGRSVPGGTGGWTPMMLAASGLALLMVSVRAEGDALRVGRLGGWGLIAAAALLTSSMVGTVLAIRRSRPGTDVIWYGLAWAACTLSLLAKPWLLALPFLLLVLDTWPLGRFRLEGPAEKRASAAERLSRARNLALEKLPFAIPAIALGVVGMWAKRGGATLIAAENLPTWDERLAQACQGIVFHLYKTVWPTGLKPIVDRPAHMGLTEASSLLAAVVVTTVLVLAFLARRRSPAPSTALLCYVLLLAPSLGLVAYSFQLVADRYSYLSTIPLFILVSGSILTAWTKTTGVGRLVVGAVACSLLLASSAASRKQAEIWQDSERLWSHTLSLGETPRALANLALVHDGQARQSSSSDNTLSESAVRLSDRAVELAREQDTFVPEYLLVQGTVQLNAGRTERAAALLLEFSDARPDNVQGLVNLGLALNRLGRFQEAARFLQRAVRRAPEDARAWRILGQAFDGAGLPDQALKAYERSARGGAIDDATRSRIQELESSRPR